mmetsp:Transcript_22502/g.66388  ORF Transcript_22502/g.66388 Transcript_22502/m.66388 type:complete len:82 (+) Transcript_22502:47-292(+)
MHRLRRIDMNFAARAVGGMWANEVLSASQLANCYWNELSHVSESFRVALFQPRAGLPTHRIQRRYIHYDDRLSSEASSVSV